MLCFPPFGFASQKVYRDITFSTMAATSLNEGNVVPTLVGARVENVAKGSWMSGEKRAASQSPTKPRISSNLDGRRRGPKRLVRNGPGVVAAATRVSGKPHAVGKKTRSGGKAAHEESGATILKSPVGRLVTVRTDTPVRARNASDESLDDVSSKCKEAGGAQDNVIHEEDEDKDDKDDADEDDGEETIELNEEAVELTLLRREMDTLEQRMYSKGTVASVFARTVTHARLAENPFGAEAIAAMAAIFKGNDTPDTSAVAAALEPSAARTWAYLVVMNDDVGFSCCITCSEWTERFVLGTQSSTILWRSSETFDHRDPPLTSLCSQRPRTPCSSGSICPRRAWLKPTPGTALGPMGMTNFPRLWSTRRSQHGSRGRSHD